MDIQLNETSKCSDKNYLKFQLASLYPINNIKMLSNISFLGVLLSLNAFLELRVTANDAAEYGKAYRSFKSVPTTFKTYENDTVLLPCYSNAPVLYLSWFRDNLLLKDSREEPGPSSTLGGIFLWPNGSLQMSNIKKEDTGEYVCEVTSSTGSHRQLHDIEVQYPPTIIFSPTGVVELPKGSMLEVVCDAKGVPYPTISLTINSTHRQENLDSKKRTILEILSREMSGVIECEAKNGVGAPAIARAHLIVLFAPEITVGLKTVHTKIGMYASLECIVVAAPASTVHWFLGGNPVQFDLKLVRRDHELRSNKSVEEYVTESQHILLFKRVRDTDFGIYECRAENKVGFKGAFIELTGKPKVSIFKTSVSVSSSLEEHHLIWLTESLSPIIEYRLKFRNILSGDILLENWRSHDMWNELTIPAEYSEGPIHSMSYSIRGLQPASVYEVNVASRNRYGWNDVSRTIRFASGGEVALPTVSTEHELQSEKNTNISTEDSNLTGLIHNSYDFEYERTYSRGSQTSLLHAIFFSIIFSYVISFLI